MPHLVESKNKKSGRNVHGEITMRHQGGGHKQHYRMVDFKRDKDGIPAKVERLEYDPEPQRVSRPAAATPTASGATSSRAKGVTRGHAARYRAPTRPSSPATRCRSGTSRSARPSIASRCCPGKGAQLARAAGTAVQLLAREGDYAQIRLRSGEIRKVHINCRATIGEVGNEEHSLESIGKAGRVRWRGVRPTVRGVAMNPIDHPHGGGEGSKAAARDPVSPWGVLTKGYKTRKNKRTDAMIVRRRNDKVAGG